MKRPRIKRPKATRPRPKVYPPTPPPAEQPEADPLPRSIPFGAGIAAGTEFKRVFSVPAQEHAVQPGPFTHAGVQDGGAAYTADPLSPSSRAANTTIAAAVLRNRAEIELLGMIFLHAVNEKLESLRQARLNSDDAAAEIADYEDLKGRIEAFLDRAAQFADKPVAEQSAAKAATSFAEGITNWWSKRHVEICDKAFDKALKAFDMALFGVGVSICLQAGAGGYLAAIIPGVIVGGKPVAEAIKSIFKSPDKGKGEHGGY